MSIATKSKSKKTRGRCTDCNYVSFDLKVIVGTGKILRICKRCGNKTEL